MNMIWLCITVLLSLTSISCNHIMDTSHIRVFPGANQSIAGVFQVSYVNDLSQSQYAFNASEARRLCSSLGVKMASKAQVKEALARGLETCRFGWIDEHLAVIPRNKALPICGQNQTGLVTWRAAVSKMFDVFCFNETDAEIQLKDTATDSPLSSTDNTGQTQSPSESASSTHIAHPTSSRHLTSPSPTMDTDSEAEPARFVGGAQDSARATAILITSACALLFAALMTIVYIKMRKSRFLSTDIKQQQEYIETEEWTCVKNTKETNSVAQEEERIEVEDSDDRTIETNPE
ncbi:uncharacterized protein V6R79_023275 [Siganus canaliculatus]